MSKSNQQRILDELREAYIDKKLLTDRTFEKVFSKNSENKLHNASVICMDHGIEPSQYVSVIYRYCPKKEFFGLDELSGAKALEFVTDHIGELTTSMPLMTNETTPYLDLWKHYLSLLDSYQLTGHGSVEDILLNSMLKFPAWFRVLCSDNENYRVINKYAAIANKELNSRLREFIQLSRLPIKRIGGAQ